MKLTVNKFKVIKQQEKLGRKKIVVGKSFIEKMPHKKINCESKNSKSNLEEKFIIYIPRIEDHVCYIRIKNIFSNIKMMLSLLTYSELLLM